MLVSRVPQGIHCTRASAVGMAQPLSLLMEAPSKDIVQHILTHVYMHRNNIAQANAAKFAAMFEKADTVTEEHVQQLFAALHGIVTNILYDGANTAEQIRVGLDREPASASLDEQLKVLLTEQLAANVGGWREASIMSMPSLPKFVDVDWRVDVKSATEQVGRMAVPTVLVDLKTRQQPVSTGMVPGTETVSFELSKEALDTMVDGLGRIRDQLGNIK